MIGLEQLQLRGIGFERMMFIEMLDRPTMVGLAKRKSFLLISFVLG
jgi:hypothetical protein